MEEEEINKISLSYEDQKILEHFHKLHCFTKTQEHFIKQVENTGDYYISFEPSSFIYSYFTLNSIYHYNWEIFVKTNSLNPHTRIPVLDKDGIHKKDEKNKLIYDKLNEGEKVEIYIKFIFDHISNKDLHEFLFKIKFGLDYQKIFDLISKVKLNESQVKGFKNCFKLFKSLECIQYYDTEEKENIFNKVKWIILEVIMKTRNNIFHGSKNTIKMTEKNQRIRLLFYSNFINQLNELFFQYNFKGICTRST